MQKTNKVFCICLFRDPAASNSDTVTATGGAGIKGQIKSACDHFLRSCWDQCFQKNHFVAMDVSSHVCEENKITDLQLR